MNMKVFTLIPNKKIIRTPKRMREMDTILIIYCGIFLTFNLNMRNVAQNTVSPTEHCYGST